MLWAKDSQFDSTVDGKAIKIASMIDEHTRQSLLNIVERSITAQRLTGELDKTFVLWDGPPQVLRTDNGPEFISHVLQHFCATVSVSPTSSRGRRGTTDTSNPSTIDYGGPQPQSLDELARSEGGDRGLQRPPQPSTPALITRIPHAALGVPPACGGVRCPMHPQPPTGRGLRGR